MLVQQACNKSTQAFATLRAIFPQDRRRSLVDRHIEDHRISAPASIRLSRQFKLGHKGILVEGNKFVRDIPRGKTLKNIVDSMGQSCNLQ
jgi:hypothetical protein